MTDANSAEQIQAAQNSGIILCLIRKHKLSKRYYNITLFLVITVILIGKINESRVCMCIAKSNITITNGEIIFGSMRDDY